MVHLLVISQQFVHIVALLHKLFHKRSSSCKLQSWCCHIDSQTLTPGSLGVTELLEGIQDLYPNF